MRIACRMAQVLIDKAFQVFREHVLQLLGFLMNSVPGDTKCSRQVCFQKPMVTDHLQGGSPPRLGQGDSLIRFIAHQFSAGKLLQHACHSWSCVADAIGKHGSGHLIVLQLEGIRLFQIILFCYASHF